ncbi:glyceraldehyde-3-phosphate dehydrogenase [Bacillaceae bacterium S4-13-58]
MKTRIAINGFGRIGRMVFRKAIENPELEIVAINASYPSETLAHLVEYDSIHGRFDGTVHPMKDGLLVNGHKVLLLNGRNPEELPWEKFKIDIVIEATGKFTTKESAGAHLDAGAKKVIITAPGKDVDATIVMGVNEGEYDDQDHHIVSNASCTTNCLAPVAKVIDQAFTIKNGFMTTIHSYTSDQKNLDNPHKDLRRARACGQSIVPTTTGAAKAIAEVLPNLKGKLHGMALRVPTPNVSLVDLVVDVEKKVTKEMVNRILAEQSRNDMLGILGYTDKPLVSIDFTTSPQSAIIDGLSTLVLDNHKIKVIAWYDNEWGYSCRVVDLAVHMHRMMTTKKEVHAS